MCHRGGQLSRAAGRQSQGLPRNVPFVHARASVSTLLLYALGWVVRCPAALAVPKARLDFFSAILAQRHNIDAGTAFYFIFERQHRRTDFAVAKFFFLNHGLVNFLEMFFPR